MIGWGNLSVVAGELQADCGYTLGKAPRDAAFRSALRHELDRISTFLGLAA